MRPSAASVCGLKLLVHEGSCLQLARTNSFPRIARERHTGKERDTEREADTETEIETETETERDSVCSERETTHRQRARH